MWWCVRSTHHHIYPSRLGWNLFSVKSFKKFSCRTAIDVLYSDVETESTEPMFLKPIPPTKSSIAKDSSSRYRL